jgi:hypothetical protein
MKSSLSDSPCPFAARHALSSIRLNRHFSRNATEIPEHPVPQPLRFPHDAVCFTICLCTGITGSPNFNGYQGTKNQTLSPERPTKGPETQIRSHSPAGPLTLPRYVSRPRFLFDQHELVGGDEPLLGASRGFSPLGSARLCPRQMMTSAWARRSNYPVTEEVRVPSS